MFVVQRLEAIQYDGTNGSFIANDWLEGVTLTSDDGQTLVLTVFGGNHQVQSSDWVVCHVPDLTEFTVVTDDVFDVRYQQA